MGCPSPKDESKQAKKHVKEAIPIAEEAVKKVYPDAIIKGNTFYGISGTQVGPDHLVTDWVRGEYLDGGKEEIMINVLTKDIYVTSEWNKISSYGMKAARDLFGLDSANTDGYIYGYKEEPYCADDPDKYGNLEIWNMLPLGTVVSDDFARDLLNNEEYSFLYEIVVNEDVDMKIFEDTDYTSLGSNVHLKVEQFDNENKSIATFDSQIDGTDGGSLERFVFEFGSSMDITRLRVEVQLRDGEYWYSTNNNTYTKLSESQRQKFFNMIDKYQLYSSKDNKTGDVEIDGFNYSLEYELTDGTRVYDSGQIVSLQGGYYVMDEFDSLFNMGYHIK
ncbi:hypothetical protein [Butyrivibrio sp. WCD2001]|uniref:hypothetical protein n=1 Tax=Butyrivibrio sp. WCD2001 TaxID=1280681 RepID=UPI000426DAEE|nr:hypothetical protein [Butyrivibrio sp. WCD2001]